MALELILLRHGEAEFSFPDSERDLTSKGAEQTRQVIRQRSASLAGLTAVYVSPYRRAQQTFAVIAEIADLPAPQYLEMLQPESSVTALMEWLQPQQGKILLVAHNPLLTLLLHQLIGSASHSFDTSTLACLRMPIAAVSCAELAWIEYSR